MRGAETHDFTRGAWGSNVNVLSVENKGARIRVAGWSQQFIMVGDYLLLPNQGGVTRYQVQNIERQSDPPDMWFAWLEFAPRAAGNE